MKKDRFWNWLAKNYDDEVGEQTTKLSKESTCKAGGFAEASKRGQILGADLLRAAHSLPDILHTVVSCSHLDLPY